MPFVKLASPAVLSFGYLILTFPLALLIQLLVLLLVPMSLIPPLYRVVAPVQRWISGVIGDTYVLLTSRFQFQSMVSKVGEDLKWLGKRCDVVAVLAHSQGAAIAHEAVRQAEGSKVERLITFGSALSRLKALRHVMEHARGMLTASSLVTLSALVLAALYLWNLDRGGDSILYTIMGIWSLAVLLALSAYLMPFTLKDINEQCHEQQGFALAQSIKWEDYYATDDPIPNGRMYPVGRYVSESREVHNEANVLTDHATYWRNLDEFGCSVLYSLMQVTGGAFAECLVDPRNLHLASQRRTRHVRYRVATRLAAIVGASSAVFQHPVVKEGVPVPGALSPWLGWMAGLVNWVISLVEDVVGIVASTLNVFEGPVNVPRLPVAVTVLSWPVLCTLIALSWYVLGSAILSRWAKAETENHFRTSGTSRAAWPRQIWWMALVVLGCLWLGFWATWLLMSPGEVWAAIAAKLKPLLNTTATTAFYVLPVVFQLVFQLVKNWLEGIKMRKLVILGREDIERILSKYMEKIASPSLEEMVARIKDSRVKEAYRRFAVMQTSGSPPNSRSTVELLKDECFNIVDRLGKRRFSGEVACWVALMTALSAVSIELFQFEIRTMVQGALGLASLAFGVLGWVRSRGIASRMAAGLGLVIGVAVMPAKAAWDSGLTSLAGISLLVVGVTAAVSAVIGAEFLRRGWEGVNADAQLA